MQSRKFWFQTIGLSISVAILFGVIIATVTATAVLAFGQKDPSDPPQVQSVSGLLTDSRCGARHPSNSAMTSEQCARFCIKQGNSWALVDGDKVYALRGDSAAYDTLAGQRVKVTGSVDGRSIQVQSIQPQNP